MRPPLRTTPDRPRRQRLSESGITEQGHAQRVAELQREVATLEEMQRALERIRRRMIRRLTGPGLGPQ